MFLNSTKLFNLFFLVVFNNFILAKAISVQDFYDRYSFANSASRSINYSDSSTNIIFDSEKLFLYELQDFLHKYNYGILADLLSQISSGKCLQDFKFMFESLPYGGWPIKMLDSFGKPESGILKGNIRWVGEFDDCLEIYAPLKESKDVGNFHGKYCTLQMTVEIEKNITFSMGVCLPDTCNSFEIAPDVAKYLNLTGLIPENGDKINRVLNSTKLTCHQPPESLTAGAVSVICLISFFVLLALIGSSLTIYEYFIETNDQKSISTGDKTSENLSSSINVESTSLENNTVARNDQERRHLLPTWLEKSKGFFNCFCLITNGERILNTDSVEGQLPCLHGIRFLSMSWVILCHAYAISFLVVRNPAELSKFIDRWTFQIVLNGFYSVDSFFLLSAFLVAHLFFKQCEKTDGKFPWLYFYIHRYIRLTPVYMIVVAFYTTLNKYLGSGPMWPDAAENTDPNCNVAWYMNLFYINNFQYDVQKCMAWTWYLAIDMQFYIISPLFLVTLWRWPKIGYAVLASFLCATYITSFILSYKYKLLTGFSNVVAEFSDISLFFSRWHEYFRVFYVKPYTRFDPYLIGIALAYFLFKRKRSNSGKLNLAVLFTGWSVAAGVTLTCLFGLYHQTPSVVGSSFYNALNRTGYTCGLAWVIFVCLNEQGGAINSILSWKFWIPLSRLTFCAYLLHPIIEMVYFSSLRRPLEFSHTTLIMHYLGFLILSYIAALVTSLLFESPVIRLEKFIRNKFSS